MRNKVRAVSSLPIAFVQTHSGSLVALRFDSSIFLIGTEVPVVSSPRTVYDVHILIWVPLHKPHHPLDRYYTIAEPGLCTYGVRARPAPGSEEAPLQHIQIPALGERKQRVLVTEGGLCVRKRGLFGNHLTKCPCRSCFFKQQTDDKPLCFPTPQSQCAGKWHQKVKSASLLMC